MELKSDLSKEYIADALIDLMKKKDYSSITNKDITDRAGLSHITIYRNFKNRDEILKYYLSKAFEKCKLKWNDNNNIAYNIFSFFLTLYLKIYDIFYIIKVTVCDIFMYQLSY